MIEYQYGQGIEDRGVYAAFLKREWGSYGPADAEAFERRIINAGNGIIAMRCDDRPAAILETLRIPIIDVNEMGDFNFLTGNGTFSTYAPKGRMLVMADLTVHPDMQGRGLSKIMITDQLRHYLGNCIERFVTFSPETARRLHESMGAQKVGEIKGARREYAKSPNVMVFEYPIDVIESFAVRNR